tara:strand:- start:473 stop:1096 length:624 start_codon:yes stop_codon:yes gene_type:complete
MDNHHQIQIIENKIVTIRGQQVMLDRDLAELYQVETKYLKRQVNRNAERFPSDFMFQLTKEEFENWRCQNVTSNSDKMGLRYLPYAFTEHGCIQVCTVLKSLVARKMSVFVVRAFVAMKKQIFSNPNYEILNERMKRLEAETKLFNAKADTINADVVALKADHKIDLNIQNMEINDLNEKMTDLLNEFNKFRDDSIIIKKDDSIGRG